MIITDIGYSHPDDGYNQHVPLVLFPYEEKVYSTITPVTKLRVSVKTKQRNRRTDVVFTA